MVLAGDRGFSHHSLAAARSFFVLGSAECSRALIHRRTLRCLSAEI